MPTTTNGGERRTMKNQLLSLTVGMLMLALLGVGSVASATDYPELAVNGGFEASEPWLDAGSPISGWTQSGNMTSGNWGGTGIGYDGSNDFWAANSPDMGYLSQTIATVPTGLNYTISFTLGNWADGDRSAEFIASFGGITLLDLVNPDSFDLTNYSFNVGAYAGSSAELKFGFYNTNGYWELDNVSVKDPECIENCDVAPVPEPSTWLLFGSGLAGLVAWRYRTRKLATA